MLCLSVDTSNTSGSLAMLRDAEVLGMVASASDEPYSSRLFRHLEFLLGELKLSLAEVELFAVGTGPGSFTGLRVGLAAVKGWAEVYGKPIAGVSGIEAVAAQAIEDPGADDGLIVSVLDARRGEVYGCVYQKRDAALVRLVPEYVLPPEEFLGVLRESTANRKVTFVTTARGMTAAMIANTEFATAPVRSASRFFAPVIGRIGIERATRGELVNSLELDANYVRRSDAEVLWKAR
jgi:tRNA threonylcarbamoyladenosine biosynthesis protein TsaB